MNRKVQTIAIMRPKAQLDASRKLVEAHGYDTAATSLVEVTRLTDRRWFPFMKELRSGVVDYVLLTSVNGVHCSAARGLSASDVPAHTRMIAIGPRTREALLSAGFHVDTMPQEFSSDGLLKLLQDVAGCNIWLLRSAYGSVSLVDELRRREAVVNEVVMYTLRQLCGPIQRSVIHRVIEGDVAAVLFTSTMTVRGFFECASHRYSREAIVQALRTRVVGAIGRPTEQALRSCGVLVDVVPANATFSDLVSSVHEALIGGESA